MTNSSSSSDSAAKLWKASFFAVLLAFILLFTLVLPRSFDIGLGAGDAADPSTQNQAVDTEAASETVSEPDPMDELAALMAGDIVEAEAGTHKSYEMPAKTEVVSIPLASLEEVEYKAYMKAGDTIMYSWKSNQTMYVDVHGEPPTYPEEKAVRYEEVDGVTSGQGWIKPSIDGRHGWFWMNTGDEDDVIELTIRGYYEKAEEVYRSSN